jgi:2-hydroxychromene-2-carboxylate isomerase
MGELISLAARRRAGSPDPLAGGAPRGCVALAFDLASPCTYLVAERADRLVDDLAWRPVLMPGRKPAAASPAERERVQRRAAALHLPLVWPEHADMGARGAMRIAAHAAEQGRARAFVLAATRLAFCGGFDLDDPDVLLEAAAAANLRLRDCLAAATDEARDAALLDAGRRLAARGADRLPAMLVAHRVFCGEDRLAEAVAAARADAWELHRRRAGGR